MKDRGGRYKKGNHCGRLKKRKPCDQKGGLGGLANGGERKTLQLYTNSVWNVGPQGVSSLENPRGVGEQEKPPGEGGPHEVPAGVGVKQGP